MAHDGGRARAGFKGHTPPRYRVLGFGERFRWRCLSVTESFAEDCSPHRGTTVFICTSRRTGLTCSNRDRHGFWLGRYRGYRVF